MKHVHSLRLLALVLVLLAPAAANAAILQFIAPLGVTGAQEVPPRATPATGTGFALYDDVALLLFVGLDWQDLLAPASAAHIHCCSGPGVNSTVAIDFVPAGFPSVTSGSFSHLFDLDSAASYGSGFLGSFGGDVDAARAAFIAGLTANLAYFNIHTSVFPGGEIRGDIELVPEPGSMILMLSGLAAVAVGGARRLRLAMAAHGTAPQSMPK